MLRLYYKGLLCKNVNQVKVPILVDAKLYVDKFPNP
jgi:hypothetical protein